LNVKVVYLVGCDCVPTDKSMTRSRIVVHEISLSVSQ